MKLIHNNQYLKILPKKFLDIKNIVDFLEDESVKRLTPIERNNLKKALFQQRVSQTLLSYLSQHEPLILEQVGEAKPMIAYKVSTNDGQLYYVLKFDNNVTVRCSEIIYRMSPNRGKLKYASCLATNKVPPPCTEQLQLFTSNNQPN